MKLYAWIALLLLLLFFVLFGLVQSLQLAILNTPEPLFHQGGLLAALLGTALLVADVYIPVPSSLIMIANGALFGWKWGTLVSIIGAMGASWLGFWTGKKGGRIPKRLLTESERNRAEKLVTRYGLLAVLITRPIPVISEAVATIAGTTRLGWGGFTLASLLGSFPATLIYAWTGSTSVKLESVPLIFGLVTVVAAAFWFLGRAIIAESTEMPQNNLQKK